MHAFISCCLDYCNALLAGLPKKSISNLQLLQNSAAQVFQSGAPNLVPGDTNEAFDVFVFNRLDNSVERVSLTHQGLEKIMKRDHWDLCA